VATPAGSRLDIRLPSIPGTRKQRKDLRRALAGAMGNDVQTTDHILAADTAVQTCSHEVTITQENDLDKTSDNEESK
ncbi:blood vessel epicardial substance-B-like isoform X1, partial [Biomphalaria pfeifferi]